MSNPKISIIIPVYNVQEHLRKCLDSALCQTYEDIEIIAVNDGSTDGSGDILKEYKNRDSRVHVLTQQNMGLSAARNSGIKQASGEFILFLDSDDYIHKDMAKEMLQKAEECNAEIIICRYSQVNEFGEVLYESLATDKYSKDEHFKRILSAKASSMACDKLFKRRLFVENEIEFPKGMYHEDVYTIYKLFHFASDIRVVERSFYNWLKREGSISKSVSNKHIEDIYNIILDTKEFLQEHDIYTRYKKEYIRRGVHFLFGLTDRVNTSELSEDEKQQMRALVWRKLVLLEFNTKSTLSYLAKIDRRLYSKLKLKIYYSSKGKKMIYKIADKLLPKGSNRREMIKKILFKSSYVEPVKSTKPMLNVAEAISLDEIKELEKLKDKFKGKRCFIVGNGPSLNKCDLTLLENEYSFAVNGIFYKTEEMGFKPTFYMVEDGHVVDDNLKKINEYDPEYKLFPSLYREKIKKRDNTYFFSADLGFYRGDHPSYCKPRFSKDFSKVAYAGQSVTYLNMQLAHYLGFSEVYLIGMDFSYQIRESDEVRGATLVSNEDDVNHFHPDYFGKGKKWHDPKVDRVALNYEFAKKVFEEDGRKIYNATIGGKLEIFDRVDYNSLFQKK